MNESQLPKCYPDLIPSDEELKAAADELFPAYNDYVHHVSPFVMAISLDTASYILWAARKIGAESALDMGTGFTSYVLRLVCDDVTSVDDSTEWLDWTNGFLTRYGKSHIGVLTDWDLFHVYDHRERDIVVYDFSGGQNRIDHFGTAFDHIVRGGIGILDDAQQELVQNAMHATAAERKWDLFGLRNWTLDHVDRYAALVVRP